MLKRVILFGIISILLVGCGVNASGNGSKPDEINEELWLLSNSVMDDILAYYMDGEELNEDFYSEFSQYEAENGFGQNEDLTVEERVLLSTLSTLSLNMILHDRSGNTILDNIDDDIDFMLKTLNRK